MKKIRILLILILIFILSLILLGLENGITLADEQDSRINNTIFYSTSSTSQFSLTQRPIKLKSKSLKCPFKNEMAFLS